MNSDDVIHRMARALNYTPIEGLRYRTPDGEITNCAFLLTDTNRLLQLMPPDRIFDLHYTPGGWDGMRECKWMAQLQRPRPVVAFGETPAAALVALWVKFAGTQTA